MGKIAFVFPGQGSQTVGMGLDLQEKFSELADIYERADEILGFPISHLSFGGPIEELRITSNTQPALLLNSYVLLTAIEKLASHVQADYYAGHSLGEYSALLAAGAIDFDDALTLVHKRGLAMERAAQKSGGGSMAAVLGLDRETLSNICENLSKEGQLVELANINCPGQIIISGSGQAVQEAGDLAKDKGAKRVIGLEVSGPFHSSMMQEAESELANYLDKIKIKDIERPVIANVTARPITRAEDIKDLLIKQVTGSVLWEDSISYLLDQGVDTFIEIGPGKVLTGLIKKINRQANVYNVSDYQSLVELTDYIAGISPIGK